VRFVNAIKADALQLREELELGGEQKQERAKTYEIMHMAVDRIS
jgi:hypothetical protein